MQNSNLSVQQRLNIAMQLMHSGQFEQALSHFFVLKKLGVNDFRLSRAMGSAYERLSKDKEAQQFFAESLALNPKQPDLSYAQGNIASREKNFELAIKHFKSALAIDSKNARVWLRLGQTYLSMEQLTLAEQAFTKCTLIEPGNVDGIIGSSRVLQNRNLDNQARGLLTSLLNQLPNDVRVLSELAWLNKNSGDYKKSADLFSTILTLHPNNPECYEDLALVKLELGEPQEALEILQQGLIKAPKHRKLNEIFSALKYEMNIPDHFSHYRDTSIENMPNELISDFIAGLIKTDQIEQAKEYVHKLNACTDKKVIATHMQLALWEKDNNYISIIDHYLGQLNKNVPLSATENERLVKAYLAVGDNIKAQNLLSNLLSLAPNNQYLWALNSTVLRQLNSPDYQLLCNYDSMVFKQPLALNLSNESIEQYCQRLRFALNEVHTSKRNPLDQSLRNGTQTTGNLFARQVPVIQELKVALKDTIDAALNNLIPQANHPFYKHAGKNIQFSANWSVKLTNQGFHISHVHPKGWLSSAFYVHLPSSISNGNKQGWLHFGKPGIYLPEPLEAQKWIKPEVGQLVLFPSYFWHGTEPFAQNQERMSVAFDLLPAKDSE